MLDAETKKHIDNARDVLVGKVPDPKSQIDQITIALIYKFMDDMDAASEELGGKPSFFTGKYKQYSWATIMNQKVGGKERLDLYMAAIESMSTNKNLPQLFRDIFKGAFLPYRDPETLNLFLKEINWFDYEHSENLGTGFEYLLQIMGAQGDAGQFRTPRHIIDFMVEVIDPKKNETILDPACGTAGFLISAYNHILNQNTKKNKGDKLTPDDRKKLGNNIVGYDISPDMVRLSRVNMYLHGFQTPKIQEYDTLTSEANWGDNFDVILANPPFMTPKGGIRPHKRFAIQANRAEVLFVDYIMEHVNLKGRAAVIVPEGIIFKADGACTALRKKLIEENYLWAVVSLPAGVFNPYAGVKTSILFLDKETAKKVKEILFVKISNDGFDLGAQRREITQNDIPDAVEMMKKYLETVEKGLAPCKDVKKHDNCSVVIKTKLAENGEFNLTADRYIEQNKIKHDKWDMVKLEEILEYEQPTKYIVKSVDYNDDYNIPVLTAGKTFILGYTNEQNGVFKEDLPVIIFDDFTTAMKLVDFQFKVKSSAMKILHIKKGKADIKYVFYMMKNIQFSSGTHKRYWISEYSKIKIPLPHLKIQREIVAEIEGYQKIIDGARMVVDNWKPRIDIDPAWPMEPLGKFCSIMDGTHFSPDNKEKGDFKYITAKNIKPYSLDLSNLTYVSEKAHKEIFSKCPVAKGDILYIKDGATAGIAAINDLDEEFSLLSSVAVMKPHKELMSNFLLYYLNSEKGKQSFLDHVGGVAITRLTLTKLNAITIPLPPINIQNDFVKLFDSERETVDRCKKLIINNQNKIRQIIDKVWI